MITQPIIHDRHIVKQVFENMKINNIYKNKFKTPANLTIVLCRNKGSLSDRIIPHLSGYEDISILESNLNYIGINDYVVLSKNIPPGENQWKWTNKIKWILEFLQGGLCKTDYIMYCDPIDVIFQDSPTRVLNIFKTFNCDLLFMSTKRGLTDGYMCMPDVKTWADSDPLRKGRYINAGVFIGKTSFVKEFLEVSMRYCTEDDCTIGNWYDYLKSNPPNFPVGASDQDIFRFLEPKFYPRLKVDYQNLMAYRS
jgi:hypothetical protein